LALETKYETPQQNNHELLDILIESYDDGTKFLQNIIEEDLYTAYFNSAVDSYGIILVHKLS